MADTKTAPAARGPLRLRTGLAITCLSALWLACSPKVGSEAWCEKMKETPKADWSAREASDYTKHCLFQ
ncbi:MAG TPA: DUF3012 domain-containing protein [Myxococcota bacterium]